MTCKDCVHHNICIWENELEEESNAHCTSYKNKADFVEVVRCKDCEHGHWNQETCHGRPVYYCDRTDLQVGKYDFCSYGERRNT